MSDGFSGREDNRCLCMAIGHILSLKEVCPPGVIVALVPAGILSVDVYQNAFRAISVIHIQRGQNPTKRITLRVSDDVPVAV